VTPHWQIILKVILSIPERFFLCAVGISVVKNAPQKLWAGQFDEEMKWWKSELINQLTSRSLGRGKNCGDINLSRIPSKYCNIGMTKVRFDSEHGGK